MASQTSIPQSGSRHAAAEIRAACSVDGGCGSGAFWFGVRAAAAGLTLIHFHRTALSQALLRIQWICRTVDAAIGLHSCGRHRASHSWSRVVLCSMK